MIVLTDSTGQSPGQSRGRSRRTDPLAALDASRRVGWARAFSAEATLAELEAGAVPEWCVTGAIVQPMYEGNILLLVNSTADMLLTPTQARHWAGALLAAVREAERLRVARYRSGGER